MTLYSKMLLTGLTVDKHVVAALRYCYLSAHPHLYQLQKNNMLQNSNLTVKNVRLIYYCCDH